MKLNTVLALVIFGVFSLDGCQKPEVIEEEPLGSAFDYKVKKVQTYYIDEYGDQENRDGKLVGYAVFGNDGTLLNIKTTRSRRNMFQSNAPWIKRYSGIPVNRLLWVLDGGIYGQQWRNVTPFLTGDSNYPRRLANIRLEQLTERKRDLEEERERTRKDNGDMWFEVDNPNRPTRIETNYQSAAKPDQTVEIQTTLESFKYDDSGRIYEVSVKFEENDKPWRQDYTERFLYDDQDRLTDYNRNNQYIKITREDGLINRIEIMRDNEMMRWYTFSYHENGLRQSSQAFNGTGALEFSVAYSYEFYD